MLHSILLQIAKITDFATGFSPADRLAVLQALRAAVVRLEEAH